MSAYTFPRGAKRCSNVERGVKVDRGNCTPRVEHEEDLIVLSRISARGFILRRHHGPKTMWLPSRFLGMRRDAAMWRGG